MIGRTAVRIFAVVSVVASSACGELAAPEPTAPGIPGPAAPEAQARSALTVSNVTTGGEFDPDGFTIVIDGKAATTIDLNETTTLWGIADGTHTVALGGIAANCSAAGEVSRRASVAQGSVAEVRLELVCTPSPELERIRILFSRGLGVLDGSHPAGLVAMNADGSDRTQLTNGAFNDYGPDVSPDGRTIAFMRDALGRSSGLTPDIYLLSLDGSEERVIPADAYSPDWSPDGTRLVYSGSNHWGGPILVADRNGRGVTRLTGEDPFLEEAWPVWSPDGSRIAFTRVRLTPSGASGLGIWVMNADGSSPRQLAPRGWIAAWSPDGRRIAYTENPTASNIHVINADGSGAATLLERAETCCVDDWSADGRFLLFSRSARGSPRLDIYLADLSSGATVRLTADGAYNQDAVFWAVR